MLYIHKFYSNSFCGWHKKETSQIECVQGVCTACWLTEYSTLMQDSADETDYWMIAVIKLTRIADIDTPCTTIFLFYLSVLSYLSSNCIFSVIFYIKKGSPMHKSGAQGAYLYNFHVIIFIVDIINLNHWPHFLIMSFFPKMYLDLIVVSKCGTRIK